MGKKKISNEMVEEIKTLYSEKVSSTNISKKLGISRTAVMSYTKPKILSEKEIIEDIITLRDLVEKSYLS